MIPRKPPTSVRPNTRPVYVRFELRPEWQISYCDGQLRGDWYRTDAESISDMHEMYGANRMPEDTQAVDVAITNGSGGMMLNLPIEMYQRLKARV